MLAASDLTCGTDSYLIRLVWSPVLLRKTEGAQAQDAGEENAEATAEVDDEMPHVGGSWQVWCSASVFVSLRQCELTL
jgi:hypothetical protein